MSDNPFIHTVNELVDKHFTDHPVERPKLEQYTPPLDDGLLSPLLRDDVAWPVEPSKPNLPSLLMYNLDKEDDSRKQSKVYRHIETQQKVGSSLLYGTSGAGKTRSVLEYLSLNKGFYFVAGDFKLNPGSQDLHEIFSDVGNIPIPNTQEGLLDSARNLNRVYIRFRMLLFIRYIVYERVKKHLGGTISAYEWLLCQLFPVEFLGADVFLTVINECMEKRLDADDKSLDVQIARKQVDSSWSVFVDEAQRLLKKDGDLDFLNAKGTVFRSRFSALAKAVKKDSGRFEKGKYTFPIFSGTGLSAETLLEEKISADAKPQDDPVDKPLFSDFEVLDAKGVEEYMDTFLDLTSIHDDIKKHVCRWLRGRPRWTATFIQVYVARGKSKLNVDILKTRVRGDFEVSENGRILLDALDRYLSLMTEEKMKDKPRRSHEAGAIASTPYMSVHRVLGSDDEDFRDLKAEFRRAVFKFAIGNTPCILLKSSKLSIEGGVAAVETHDDAGEYVEASVDEPLVVQAALNCLKVHEYLEENFQNQEEQGKGQAFERLLLSFLLQQVKLDHLLSKQLQESVGELKDFRVSVRSSYGVLSKETHTCKVSPKQESQRESIDWIKAATNCTIEGQTPPFLFPAESFGPDITFLMWNSDFSDFRACILQSKYERYPRALDALRTLVPDWLFHQNRKNSKRASNLDGNLVEAWQKVKTSFISDDRPCLRVLVQLPAKIADSATPGMVASDGTGPKDKETTETQRDWLVTISNDDLDGVFGSYAGVVRLAKKPRLI